MRKLVHVAQKMKRRRSYDLLHYLGVRGHTPLHIPHQHQSKMTTVLTQSLEETNRALKQIRGELSDLRNMLGTIASMQIKESRFNGRLRGLSDDEVQKELNSYD